MFAVIDYLRTMAKRERKIVADLIAAGLSRAEAIAQVRVAEAEIDVYIVDEFGHQTPAPPGRSIMDEPT